MKKVLWFMVIVFCVSDLLLCGCSSKDNDDGENKEIKVAVKMFDNWSCGSNESGSRYRRSRESTPEEAMGLEKPEDLSPTVYAWVKGTEIGEYYRQSRRYMASVHKKLVDDYKVRNGSGVGATDYSNELLREWRNAFRVDYALRNFIVECYSRKELSPLPQDLARIFEPDKDALLMIRQMKSNVQRLSSELSTLKFELESIGEIGWSQKRSLDEWSTLQKTVTRVYTRINKVSTASKMLDEENVPVVQTDKAKKLIMDVRGDVTKLRNETSALMLSANEKRIILDGQVLLVQCADECAVLESELVNLKSEVAAAGMATWADEKSIDSWNELHGLMSGIASRADKAKTGAFELVRRTRPAMQSSKGDVSVAAFGERIGKLYSSLSEIAGLASDQRIIAEGNAQLIKHREKYSEIEKELVGLKSTLAALEPVSWSDKKEIEAWQSLQSPASQLAAKAGKASMEADSLVKSVNPIVQSSKGDKTVTAFGAKVGQLKTSLSIIAEKSSERLTIVKGQVPLTTFVKNLKAIADGIVKIPAAFEKKMSRMAKIDNIESQIRSSRSRDYSDLEDLARKVAEIKARSFAERKDEIAIGRRVQGLIKAIEGVMSSDAIYRLKMQVPEKPAHERIAEELNAFKRTIGVLSDSALPGYFATIESKAYQLADMNSEDGKLGRLEEILRTVQRLAASQR